MKDLKLNDLHDLDVDLFDIQTVDRIDHIIQHLKIRLRFFFREWFLNTSKGVPYFEDVFVMGPNKGRVQGLIKKQIVDTPGVLELLEFSMDYTARARELRVDFKVRVESDQVIQLNIGIGV